MVEQEERKVKTLCRMCGVSCGIDAYVKDNKVVRREPAAEFKWLGGHCPRWGAMNEFQYSSERLTHPLVRVNGDFQRASWDQAFDVIVNKLNEIKGKYGPETVAAVYGHPHIGSEIVWIVRRFCDSFGTPHIPDGGSYCWVPKEVSDYITFGDFMQHSYRDAKCVLFWCHNPWHSAPTVAVRKMLKDKKEAGDKFIVVDPRTIELAKMADIHLKVRPGADGALALGMLNVIISEGLYDKDFVQKWTVHFDKLAEHVKKYPPKWAAEVSWVPEDLIRKAAIMYATTKPATIARGVGLDQHDNTFQGNRAVSCLIAITGNVDTPGSSVLLKYPHFDLSIPEKAKLLKKPFGYEKYALWYDECTRKMNPSRVPLSILVDMILDGKIHAVLCTGKEMIVGDPNANKTMEAFKKLDLLVNMDIVMSPTCQFSHVVLPACTFFERNGIRSYQAGGGLALVGAINKAVEPLGESRSDIEFWLELGKRMGFREDFPWKDELELLDYMLKQIGTTWGWLSKNRPGHFFMPRKTRRYEQDGFDTPSGKVELYSEKMKTHGYDPLPTYREAAETPISRPDLFKDYPLVLTTGSRNHIYEASQLRHIWSLRAKFPEPLLEINPEDAQKYGIGDKDLVEVESPRGCMQAKANVTEDITKGVVQVHHGFWGKANVNLLTLDMPVDPVSWSSNMRSVLCRVKSLHNR